MDFFRGDMWWLVAFLIVTIFCIAAMLWRNRAAKTDAVLRKESDMVISNVSLKPKNNTKKLD